MLADIIERIIADFMIPSNQLPTLRKPITRGPTKELGQFCDLISLVLILSTMCNRLQNVGQPTSSNHREMEI